MLSMADLLSLQPTKKLAARWTGPYAVVELVGTHAVKLELPNHMRIHPVVNIGRLKRFVEAGYELQRRKEPEAIIMNDGTEEFEVKEVLDSRYRRGILEYMVEWKGYEGTNEAVSWEKAENLEGMADEKVSEFHRDHPLKPRRNNAPRNGKTRAMGRH